MIKEHMGKFFIMNIIIFFIKLISCKNFFQFYLLCLNLLKFYFTLLQVCLWYFKFNNTLLSQSLLHCNKKRLWIKCIWVSRNGSGIIRCYLDSASQPTVDAVSSWMSDNYVVCFVFTTHSINAIKIAIYRFSRM